MDAEDLRFVADALLALCARDRDAPFYTEQGFESKLIRVRRKESSSPTAGEMVAQRADSLLAVECRDVMTAARLTLRQQEVLNLRLEGFTFEEIGRQGRTSKQGAMSIFVQALKKISRTFRDYPYAGLSEVYRCEVKRRSRGAPFGTMVR